jgi:hypothetical protein
MASNQNFLKAASLHGLKQKFPPSCKSSWPFAKISSKLKLFMASSQDFFHANISSKLQVFMDWSQDFLQAAGVHGLKQRFHPSCNYSWPQAKISFKLQVFMA